jgi:proteasome lid subunit RPN8/RPN11
MHIHQSFRPWPGSKYYEDSNRYGHLARQLRRFSPDDEYERCGLLVGIPWAQSITVMREVTNVHQDPATNFRVLMTDVLRVQALVAPTRSVLGVIHTHPGRDRDGWRPSASDLLKADYGKVHVVYHPYTRRLTMYQSTGVRFSVHLR